MGNLEQGQGIWVKMSRDKGYEEPPVTSPTWWCLGFYSLILIHYRFKVVRFSNLKYALYSTLCEKFIFVIYFAVNAHLFENPSFSQRLIKRIISLREIPCLAYPGFSTGQFRARFHEQLACTPLVSQRYSLSHDWPVRNRWFFKELERGWLTGWQTSARREIYSCPRTRKNLITFLLGPENTLVVRGLERIW